MNEKLETPTQTIDRPEAAVPQSQEVEEEVIRRLIHDVVVPKPATMKFPKD